MSMVMIEYAITPGMSAVYSYATGGHEFSHLLFYVFGLVCNYLGLGYDTCDTADIYLTTIAS
jgi:hypothetical protein